MGNLITVVVNEGKINPTPYLWARVWLDLDKSLVQVVPITLKEIMSYLVQYEKLPRFCFHCGKMGHEVTECGNGVHSKNLYEWGNWLRIPFMQLVATRDDYRGGRGRGRGRGRGHYGGRGEWMEDEAEDMETSHGEDHVDSMGAKKREVLEVDGRGRVA